MINPKTPNTDDQDSVTPKSKRKQFFSTLLPGLVIVVAGIIEYGRFLKFDQQGGTIEVYAMEEFAYNTFGWWGPCAVTEVIGLAVIGFANYRYVKK